MRPRPCRVAAASLLLGVTLAGACRSDGPPPGVEDLRIEQPTGYYEREGFTQLVPPVHLPSSSFVLDQVEIWVRLPEDASISVHEDELGRPTLEFPPGTIADRVEYDGRGEARTIVDIRGTSIDDDGSQTFHVYRPTSLEPGVPLFGLAWAREDGEAHGAATERLLAELSALPPAVNMPQARRERFLEGVRGRNACAACHALSRPENTRPREHGLVNRSTDRSGFFTPHTVLWDEVPLEPYGAHDRSWDDPSIEVRCGDETSQAEDRQCPDGVTLPRGRLRWDAQEPDAKAHLEAVCESRAWLLAHLALDGRATLASVMAPCQKN
ncbi:MAG: hypothetical protein KC501_34115 [Myxococcales bacterium]|nr:hypothetical protein [Myxococcales bacterium]